MWKSFLSATLAFLGIGSVHTTVQVLAGSQKVRLLVAGDN